MKNIKKFENYFGSLNKHQKKTIGSFDDAITSLGGSVSAGFGKTRSNIKDDIILEIDSIDKPISLSEFLNNNSDGLSEEEIMTMNSLEIGDNCVIGGANGDIEIKRIA